MEFSRRAKNLYADREAVVDGDLRFSYAEFLERCDRWSNALQKLGVKQGDRVAYIAPNTHSHLEGYYAVPQIGAVLVPINYRLQSSDFEYILNHCGAKIVCAHPDYMDAIDEIRGQLNSIESFVALEGSREGWLEYETTLQAHDPDFQPVSIDESDLITINYTSGTTARPKGVMITHRNAYMNIMGTLVHHHLSPKDRYLWTLPMFHANGWTFTWINTARGMTHVCLRKFDPATVFRLIEEHGVTHQCGAPIILNAMAHAPEEVKPSFKSKVVIATGGAAPPSPVIAALEPMGFEVIHLYGLTEVYGPATICAWQKSWDDLDLEGRASKKARQGVVYPSLNGMRIGDPETLEAVPADGETLGELMLRGNTVMKGYLKNLEESEKSLKDGWYRTGDLGGVGANVLADEQPAGTELEGEGVADLAGGGYYDRFQARFSDGTHLSPTFTVRIVGFRPDAWPYNAPDGIPDAWMSSYFGSAYGSTASADPDGDGYDNLSEYLLGTDPSDAGSAFKLTQLGAQTLEWTAQPYALYELETSTDLQVWQSAQLLSHGSTATMQSTTVPLAEGQPARFYRVRRVP